MIPESVATTITCLLSIYGSDQVYSSSRPFMVKPFQIQSMVPESISISLASQSTGCFTSFQSFLSHTSCASSRSNPTYSPSSSLYPYGGKEASNPTIKVSSSFSTFASFLSSFLLSALLSSLLPQPARTVVASMARASSNAALFFIPFPPVLQYCGIAITVLFYHVIN